ncbi:hypothetical protein IH982_02645 [Patescibacteria group bacterium]|nr:hypothetical protein [Patescibacteria group bacterium]
MRQKTIIATAALLVGILLFGVLAVLPLLRGIKRDSKDLENQYLKVLQASSAETEVAKFLKLSQAKEEDFETIENIFVDAETPIGFIRFIEKIAATLNLTVKITPGTVKKQKGVAWPIMDFQLASSVSYPVFLRFLEKLENGPYLLKVQNTFLTRDRILEDEENIAKDVSFTLLVQVFTGPLPKVSTP